MSNSLTHDGLGAFAGLLVAIVVGGIMMGWW